MLSQENINKLLKREQKRRIGELSKLASRLKHLFKKSLKEAANIGIHAKLINGRTLDLSTKKKIDTLVIRLYENVSTEISNGIDKARIESAKSAFTIESKIRTRTKANYQELQIPFNFSKRIWKHSRLYKRHITDTLINGIKKGTGAKDLAKELATFTHAKVSGTGIYKNHIKNAERLAKNEINNYYRRADCERWKQQKFVKGIEVRLSLQHPMHDVCDNLKGKYPKDFLFTGWHIGCLCNAVPILISESEMEQLEDYELGINKKPPSIRYINNMPPNAKKWFSKNKIRISKWKNKPYWITDNKKYVRAI